MLLIISAFNGEACSDLEQRYQGKLKTFYEKSILLEIGNFSYGLKEDVCD